MVPVTDGAKVIISAPEPVWPRSVVLFALAATIASRRVTRPSPAVLLSSGLLTVRVGGVRDLPAAQKMAGGLPAVRRCAAARVACLPPTAARISRNHFDCLMFRLAQEIRLFYRREAIFGRFDVHCEGSFAYSVLRAWDSGISFGRAGCLKH